MVIVAILLFWVGVQLSAPWWYFFLLVLWGVYEIFAVGVEIGERGDEHDS